MKFHDSKGLHIWKLIIIEICKVKEESLIKNIQKNPIVVLVFFSYSETLRILVLRIKYFKYNYKLFNVF